MFGVLQILNGLSSLIISLFFLGGSDIDDVLLKSGPRIISKIYRTSVTEDSKELSAPDRPPYWSNPLLQTVGRPFKKKKTKTKLTRAGRGGCHTKRSIIFGLVLE